MYVYIYIHLQAALVYESARWYREHLRNSVSIVIISDDPSTAQHYGLKTVGVFVMSMGEYLQSFRENDIVTLELYRSLRSALDAAAIAAAAAGEYHMKTLMRLSCSFLIKSFYNTNL